MRPVAFALSCYQLKLRLPQPRPGGAIRTKRYQCQADEYQSPKKGGLVGCQRGPARAGHKGGDDDAGGVAVAHEAELAEVIQNGYQHVVVGIQGTARARQGSLPFQ